MEVHAHTHTPRKKWTHYFWEFLMLFLAVFCGFLAENQREHYIENLRARQFAISLIADLEKDKQMADVIIDQIEKQISNIDDLHSYTKDKSPDEVNNLTLASKLFLSSYRPYTWSRATIEEIKNSGSIRYFSNQKIIDNISSYDGLTHHLDEDYAGDVERINDVSRKVCEVIDISGVYDLLGYMYNLSDTDSAKIRMDSIIAAENVKKDDGRFRLLLTSEKAPLKTLINLVSLQRPHLLVRKSKELPNLKKQADELILLLKEDYHLK
jgi:hypothetical protein